MDTHSPLESVASPESGLCLVRVTPRSNVNVAVRRSRAVDLHAKPFKSRARTPRSAVKALVSGTIRSNFREILAIRHCRLYTRRERCNIEIIPKILVTCERRDGQKRRPTVHREVQILKRDRGGTHFCGCDDKTARARAGGKVQSSSRISRSRLAIPDASFVTAAAGETRVQPGQ